ncbi:MAG: CvpA family protein [Planctomycetota bacterium]|nr:CvpA family protein [Planctomycetota bacterium]
MKSVGATSSLVDEHYRRLDRILFLSALGGVAIMTPLARVAMDLPTSVAVFCVGCCILLGMWRGAAEVASFLVGSVIAVVVAPSLGSMFEDQVASLTGRDGLIARGLSITIAGLAILLLVSGVGGYAARTAIARSPGLRPWNAAVGGGLGLVQGIVLVVVVLTALRAMTPLVELRAASREEQWQESLLEDPEAPRPARDFVDDLFDSLAGSALAGDSSSEDSALSLLGDFAIVSRDPDALQSFVDSPAMKELAALPSVRDAKGRFESDPKLAALIEAEGIGSQDLMRVLESKTVVRLLDEGTVTREIAPLVPGLREALRAAKADALQRRSNPGGP